MTSCALLALRKRHPEHCVHDATASLFKYDSPFKYDYASDRHIPTLIKPVSVLALRI